MYLSQDILCEISKSEKEVEWFKTSELALIFCYLFHTIFLFACCKDERPLERLFGKLHSYLALDKIVINYMKYQLQLHFSSVFLAKHPISNLGSLSFIIRPPLFLCFSAVVIWIHLILLVKDEAKKYLSISMQESSIHHQNHYRPMENLVMKDKKG